MQSYICVVIGTEIFVPLKYWLTISMFGDGIVLMIEKAISSKISTNHMIVSSILIVIKNVLHFLKPSSS